jgi:peptidoglycan/LPS O-acetylase OafA/YrhL
MYLYAWPVQQLLIQAFGPWLNPYTLSLTALAGSGALAWLSWSFVERPFLALKRNSKPAPAQPAPMQVAQQPDAVACQEPPGAGPLLGAATAPDPPERRSTIHHGDRP